MPITPAELKTLNAEEQTQQDAAIALIDGQIAVAFDADPTLTEFSIDRAKLSKDKTVGGLKAKVRESLLNAYRDAKWKVDISDAAFVLKMPRKGGRRKNSELAAEAAAAADATEAPADKTEAPADKK